MRRISNRTQRGLGLIEVGLAMLVALIFAAGAMALFGYGDQKQSGEEMVQRVHALVDASDRYASNRRSYAGLNNSVLISMGLLSGGYVTAPSTIRGPESGSYFSVYATSANSGCTTAQRTAYPDRCYHGFIVEARGVTPATCNLLAERDLGAGLARVIIRRSGVTYFESTSTKTIDGASLSCLQNDQVKDVVFVFIKR